VNGFELGKNPPRGAFLFSDEGHTRSQADGWQAGDNGGFGFTGWGFNGTYNSVVQHTLDGTSPYNQLGLAWTLYNPNGPAVGSPNPPEGGTDISRAGRGFAQGALQVGQTISAVIDNPTERRFFRGYTIRLVSGGHNTSYGDPTAVSRLAVGTFEYFTYGRWYSPGNTSLFDTDTDAGMRLDITLTGANEVRGSRMLEFFSCDRNCFIALPLI
jgi:hypothetical protein